MLTNTRIAYIIVIMMIMMIVSRASDGRGKKEKERKMSRIYTAEDVKNFVMTDAENPYPVDDETWFYFFSAGGAKVKSEGFSLPSDVIIESMGEQDVDWEKLADWAESEGIFAKMAEKATEILEDDDDDAPAYTITADISGRETKMQILRQAREERAEAVRVGSIVENWVFHMHNEHGDAVADHARKMNRMHMQWIEKIDDAIANGDDAEINALYEKFENHD